MFLLPALLDPGRGGVILVKEPFAISPIYSHADVWGQILSCEFLGHKLPVAFILTLFWPKPNTDTGSLLVIGILTCVGPGRACGVSTLARPVPTAPPATTNRQGIQGAFNATIVASAS